jgi:hypothetical protein
VSVGGGRYLAVNVRCSPPPPPPPSPTCGKVVENGVLELGCEGYANCCLGAAAATAAAATSLACMWRLRAHFLRTAPPACRGMCPPLCLGRCRFLGCVYLCAVGSRHSLPIYACVRRCVAHCRPHARQTPSTSTGALSICSGG